MKLARFLTHRFTIIGFNVVIIAISLSALHDTLRHLVNTVIDPDMIEIILDGAATIFVAYGVALEERETIMRFFGLYPKYLGPLEERVDHVSHFTGLMILIFGLFMEVAVEMVKLPNKVFDFPGIESMFFAIGVIFITLSVFILARQAFLLATARE